MGWVVSIVVIVFCVLISSFKLLYMPKFFKAMPKREEWFEKDLYELVVFETLFFKERDVICKTVYTTKLNAYIRVRLLALKRDIETLDSHWDVLWSYGKAEKGADENVGA